MTKNLPITAIELEGFQCFEKPTRIEFAPITLLYGPNSAGKSAIFDALDLLAEFWNPYDKDHQKINSFVDRWARRTKGTKEAKSRSIRIAIEFPFVRWWMYGDPSENDGKNLAYLRSKFSTNTSFGSSHSQFTEVEDVGDWLDKQDQIDEVLNGKLVRMEFTIHTIDHFDGKLSRILLDRYSIHIGDRILVEGLSGWDASEAYEPSDIYETHGRDTIVRLFDYGLDGDPFAFTTFAIPPMRNEFLSSGESPRKCSNQKELDASLNTASFFEMHPEYEDISDSPSDYFADWETIDEGAEVFGPVSRDYFEVAIRGSEPYSVYSGKLSTFSCPFSHNETHSWRHSGFASHVNLLFGYFSHQVHDLLKEVSPPMVSGNRGLPDISEFAQQVNLSEEMKPSQASDPIKYFNHLLLRASHASKVMDVRTGKWSEGFDDWATIVTYGAVENDNNHTRYLRERLEKESQLFESVNHMLSSHLFQTKLYQFVGTSKLLLDFDPKIPDPARYVWTYVGSEAFVTLKLLDSSETELTFEDVGSGIGYFLPCLVAIHQEGVIRIQQPELHLHPALQASVGDVLVQSLQHESSLVICETHSEHMLLRILKRVRQQSHSLSAEDIVAYYFDPIGPSELEEVAEIGNETVVTRQEISPFGDFVHRWPKGFFEERWQELNDD